MFYLHVKSLVNLSRINLLYMTNWGTQWTMVSYLKELMKIRILKREKDPGERLGSTFNLQ